MFTLKLPSSESIKKLHPKKTQEADQQRHNLTPGMYNAKKIKMRHRRVYTLHVLLFRGKRTKYRDGYVFHKYKKSSVSY